MLFLGCTSSLWVFWGLDCSRMYSTFRAIYVHNVPAGLGLVMAHGFKRLRWTFESKSCPIRMASQPFPVLLSRFAAQHWCCTSDKCQWHWQCHLSNFWQDNTLESLVWLKSLDVLVTWACNKKLWSWNHDRVFPEQLLAQSSTSENVFFSLPVPPSLRLLFSDAIFYLDHNHTLQIFIYTFKAGLSI